MTNETQMQHVGILPLVTYNHVGRPTSLDVSGGWRTIWKPGYSVFKFRRKVRDGVTDWGVVEMGGLVAPMYDFCGGMLTSSPQVLVHSLVIDTYERTGAWYPLSDTNVRNCWATYVNGGSSRRQRLRDFGGLNGFLEIVPSVDPYLGPGPFTTAQMTHYGRRSVAAWLATMALRWGRRGVWGADRTQYTTNLRNTLRLMAGLEVAWYGNPQAVLSAVGPNYRIVGETGAKTSMFPVAGTKFSGGRKFRNPNSGRAVSMCMALMPASERGSWLNVVPNHVAPVINSIPDHEWAKLSAVPYLELLPADLFHNG